MYISYAPIKIQKGKESVFSKPFRDDHGGPWGQQERQYQL